MIKEIRLPEISENVESGEVVQVLVSVGDLIKVDQSIVELETEKAVFEVPSPLKGSVTEINVKPGETVKVGQVIIKVDTEEAEALEEEVAEVEEAVKVKEVEEMEEGGETAEVPPHEIVKPAQKEEVTRKPAPAPPSVHRLARELGVDIDAVSGSGPGGRISMDDVKNYAKKVVTTPGMVPATPESAALKPLPDFTKWGEVKRESITKIRRIIAENTGYAWKTIPHVTQFDKADITELEEFRKRYGKEVEQAGGKLTITSIILKVTASALKVFPQFNASLDISKGEIVYKKYYHIGIAVDTDRGLLVPVIRHVDKKNILELAVELTEIAEKTRNKKISPAEMEGGNFTISNLGGIGGRNFTPIIYSPQVAILGIARANKEPIFINGQFEPRLILPLSISYDHRVIDGADGARFLHWIVEVLENPYLLVLKGKV